MHEDVTVRRLQTVSVEFWSKPTHPAWNKNQFPHQQVPQVNNSTSQTENSKKCSEITPAEIKNMKHHVQLLSSSDSSKWCRCCKYNVKIYQMLKVLFGFPVLLFVRLTSDLRVCYERCPYHPTAATFILSAMWHGAYPGYYLTFLTGIVVTLAARAVSRPC